MEIMILVVMNFIVKKRMLHIAHVASFYRKSQLWERPWYICLKHSHCILSSPATASLIAQPPKRRHCQPTYPKKVSIKMAEE